MPRKIVIYIAASLNSKIASADGGVEWLESIPHPKDEDYGYSKFYETIDTTIMGYSTYAQLKSWDIPFPYKDKKNYVLTTRKDVKPDAEVEFVASNHLEVVKEIKQKEGKDIWLVGGGKVNTLLLNGGVVDELIVHIMPIILNGGIDLFGSIPELRNLELISSLEYPSGVMELRYKVK